MDKKIKEDIKLLRNNLILEFEKINISKTRKQFLISKRNYEDLNSYKLRLKKLNRLIKNEKDSEILIKKIYIIKLKSIYA